MTNNRYQTEAMFVLDAIVDKKHPYRAYDRVVDLHALAKPLHARYSDQGRREIGVASAPCACSCLNSPKIVPTAKWSGS